MSDRRTYKVTQTVTLTLVLTVAAGDTFTEEDAEEVSVSIWADPLATAFDLDGYEVCGVEVVSADIEGAELETVVVGAIA